MKIVDSIPQFAIFAFIVKDDIEYGYLNVIPLWMFGLLY